MKKAGVLGALIFLMLCSLSQANGQEFISAQQIHTFTAAVSCDSATVQMIEQFIKDHPEEGARLKNRSSEYRERTRRNIALAEKTMREMGVEQMVKLHLVEFAKTVKKVITRTLGQSKTIGAFANECITEAKIWGAKYDAGQLTTTNNNRQAYPEKDKKTSAPLPSARREPLITEKTEVPVTVNPGTLQLYDEFTAMNRAKTARKRTKKDWQDMDKKAMELLDSMK